MKRVVLSVTNDLVNDRRVQRSIAALRKSGYGVYFVGRKLPDSRDTDFQYPSKRFKLWFNKGFLFYANYNIRLFLHLLGQKPFDLYWANDLDSFLANYLAAKWYGKKLVYDSHEYFKGVPEIQNRPKVRAIWTKLENWLYPKADFHLTVNESIADLLEADYGIRPKVVRNIAESFLPEVVKSRQELGLPESAFLIINQGAGINVDRGMEEAFDALKLLPEDVHLVLVGKGDVLPLLQLKALEEGLVNRIHFIDPLPYDQMIQYTLNANLGLSLDKGTNLNYQFSLPNKLFDYIKCQIPILSSKVVEVDRIVSEEKVGLSVEVEPQAIAEGIKKIRGMDFSKALKLCAEKHNWEKESERLNNFIASFQLK